MPLNIHPIFVHFPIALLSLYAVMELIRSKKMMELPYWFYTKAILVIAGTLGAFAALQTGFLVEHVAARELRQLVSMHAFWAITSTWIFGVISVLYLLSWIRRTGLFKPTGTIATFWVVLEKIESHILESFIAGLAALCGLAAISITGALGGAIVYGPDIDPMVSWVYHLFF